MGPYFKLFAVAAVVMGISHTVAKEKICEPVREKLGGKQTWLGYLVSCPYCLSHWIAFALVPLTDAYYVDVAFHVPVVSAVARWFLSSVLIATIAAFLRVAFYFVDESQGLVRREQKVAEKDAEVKAAVVQRAGGAPEPRPSAH
ncbi:MAG: hypothetical protein NVS3B10_13760 [Polyangiales bacterium]